MKTQNYRTKISNGSTSQRRKVSAAVSASPGKSSRSRGNGRNSQQKSEYRKHGSRAIWILMFVGGMIAAGFLLAQRSQINAHQLKRVEEDLKSELDTLSSQQRYLLFQKERALSTQESDRAARESGLIQPKLDRASVQSVVPGPEKKSGTKQNTKASALSTKQPVKVVKTSLIKPTAKPSGNAVKSAVAYKVKAQPASKNSGSGKVANSPQKQLAQKMTKPKGKSR